jgi:hypothetical protein
MMKLLELKNCLAAGLATLVVCAIGARVEAGTAQLEAAQDANPALIHQWKYEGGSDATRLDDTKGSLNLIRVVGEGNVGGVFGQLTDITFEPGFDGTNQAYRPYNVDATVNANSGAGLIADGFTVQSMMTIEAIVKPNTKAGTSGQNYIFGGRPGPDRLYFLTQRAGLQTRDNGRLLANIGNAFANPANEANIASPYVDNNWYYIAATYDLSRPQAQGALVNGWVANLTTGGPLVQTVTDAVLTLTTPDPPNASSVGLTNAFGVGNFPVIRTVQVPVLDDMGNPVLDDMGNPVTTPERRLFGQEFFQGAIDNLAIYNTKFSSLEVGSNFARLSVPEPGTFVLVTIAGLAFSIVRRRTE